MEDAPSELRQELVDLVFHIAEQRPEELSEERIHRVICQSLGVRASGQPYGGFRYAVGRDIAGVDWARVYDVMLRLVSEFRQPPETAQYGSRRTRRSSGPEALDEYRDGLNRILAAHGIAWELDEDGRLRRVLPAAAQEQVQAAVQELSAPEFEPALELFELARDAYDDRPRRERDACANMFDAMESVAKEKYAMPSSTFGQVVHHMGQTAAQHQDIIEVLRRVNDLRNRNFGHGMTTPFELSNAEVDFSYLACVGGILLFARTP